MDDPELLAIAKTWRCIKIAAVIMALPVLLCSILWIRLWYGDGFGNYPPTPTPVILTATPEMLPYLPAPKGFTASEITRDPTNDRWGFISLRWDAVDGAAEYLIQGSNVSRNIIGLDRWGPLSRTRSASYDRMPIDLDFVSGTGRPIFLRVMARGDGVSYSSLFGEASAPVRVDLSVGMSTGDDDSTGTSDQ